MSNIKYTSIKSVLYDLSEVIPKRYWDETKFHEWAVKASMRINSHRMLEEAVDLFSVENHTGSLPVDLKYIIQCAVKVNATQSEIDELQSIMNLQDDGWNISYDHMDNPTGLPMKSLDAFFGHIQKTWLPMRLSSTPFFKSILCDPSLYPTKSEKALSRWIDTPCENEYTVNPDMTITTNFKEGIVMVSYLRVPRSEDGDFLIPDD